MTDLSRTVRDYLKEGAGFLPSLAPNALIDTDRFLDMPMSEFMEKGNGCHWVLVMGVYGVDDEKSE